MDESESTSVFSQFLSPEELDAIPKEAFKKINTFVGEKLDELISCKALLSNTKFKTG